MDQFVLKFSVVTGKLSADKLLTISKMKEMAVFIQSHSLFDRYKSFTGNGSVITNKGEYKWIMLYKPQNNGNMQFVLYKDEELNPIQKLAVKNLVKESLTLN